MMKGSALLLCLLLPLAATAANLPDSDPVPGGVAVLELPDSTVRPMAMLASQRVMVVEQAHHWYAVVGIPLGTATGEHSLTVREPDGATLQLKFNISAKTYAVQRLTIQNPHLVNPTPAELARIEREKKHLDQVLDTWTPQPDPGLDFLWPADGPQTSGFGLQRILNGEPRSPHSGIDIGAPAGTSVRAPADGMVADVGHYYFCGNTLTINLGQGLYSVYCHLSRIDVKPGAHVTRGEVVGAIGASGRTTGPNLHWTVRLNGTAVNPHIFLGMNAPAASRN